MNALLSWQVARSQAVRLDELAWRSGRRSWWRYR